MLLIDLTGSQARPAPKQNSGLMIGEMKMQSAQPLGRVARSDVGIAVRDNGSFVDSDLDEVIFRFAQTTGLLGPRHSRFLPK